MKSSVEKTNTSATFEIEFESKDFEPARIKALERLARNVKVAGFREGKAPANVVEQHVDPNQLSSTTLDILIRQTIPKVFGDEMRFIYITDLTLVETGYAGIPEPVADGPVADDETALVLMPGLVFDPHGHRIGYGGGFYDKFLAAEPDHPTVALCFDFQVLPHLDTEKFDIPVDQVLWA